jgi:porin
MKLSWLSILVVPTFALADDGATSNWLGQHSALADHGVRPYATWTGEFFHNFKGGLQPGTDWEGLLEFGTDIDLDKAAGMHGASIHVSGLWIQDDDDPSAKLIGNFDEVSNIAAVEGVRFFQLYFKQQLAGGAFSYKLGQIALDDDFMSSSGASLFINASFGALPVETANTLAPAYPIGAPGGWAQWQPNQKFSIQTGLYDGNAGTELSNRNGIDYRLDTADGVILLTEASIATTAEGTLKLGGYFHTGDFIDYTTGAAVSNNGALYAMMDQTLIGTSDSPGLAVFLRGGFCPARDRNEVDWYIDTGITAEGFRAHDRVGVGFAHAHFGDAFVSAQTFAGSPVTHAESVIEFTYLVQITSWFTLQPDIQYVIHPQNTAASGSLVAGLRAKIIF